MSDSGPKIVAVVVTYLPDEAALGAALASLSTQVSSIVVVDNTPVSNNQVESLLASLGLANASLHRLGRNHGIAKALNVGIGDAIALGATHILQSDQDSLPAPDMVAGLLDAYDGLCLQGVRTGAVAPAFVDGNTRIAFPFQAEVPGKFFYGHVHPDAGQPVVEALTLITSGTLVPTHVFADVGLMREDFFIDHVDIEWCHRARARGWRLYGTCKANMHHSMGEEQTLRVWYLGWRQESAYPPTRMYYRIRNFVVLCGLDYIGLRWKIRNAWYWLGFIYSHVLFGRQKLGSLRMAVYGFLDGLRGRMGPFPG